MSGYPLGERTIRLDASWDVIVVGGGPSGCTAAMAAQHEGTRTLLLEGTTCLGGMGTAGLIAACCPFSDGEKIICRGLAQRVFEESERVCLTCRPARLVGSRSTLSILSECTTSLSRRLE